MKARSLFSALAITATVPALVFGVGLTSSQAATTDELSETIVDSALANLEIEVTDPALLGELQEDISTAIEEGTIDPAIVDGAETITDPAATPAPEDTAAPTDPALDDLLDENLSDETTTWEEQAPAWLAAFETIRADFETCRTDGQSTSACARTLGFQLQIAHAEAELAVIDEQIAAIANLPEEEQATALAELEAQRAELQAHLERASTKLAAAIAAGTPGADAAVQERLNGAINRAKGQANAPALPEQAQQNAPSDSGTSQNAVTPQTSTNQGGSVSVDQAPGNSGNAGKPANPGSQGKGNNKNNR